ncbi:MAG: DUF4434 domain-containing protein [Oscillospiraceae bacterium]|nr:DUF4434 domain-containing protein [Oscillospiraceae bacterium]
MKTRFALLPAAILLCAVPVSAEAHAEIPQTPLFEASFLQSWYCRGWTPEQWHDELSAMREAGFRSVILQSTVDLSYEYTDTSKPKTDASAYDLTACSALYPDASVPGSESEHALADALQAAQETGMQVYIGTVSDSRWWSYGWGVPDAYFTAWTEENAAYSANVIRNTWALYGEQYGDQIAGFYYNNEIWNIDAACAGTDGGAYAALLGANIRASVDAISALCPEKPLLISPFYNADLSSAEAYGAFLSDIAKAANLRAYDIIAPQDGGGRDYSPDRIAEWSDAVQNALGNRVRYWINNETFNADSSAKPMDTLRQNFIATAGAERHILFSWNHYYHGTLDVEFDAFSAKLSGDVNFDGLRDADDVTALHRWLMHDRIAVQNWIAADFDADDTLTAADLTLLKRSLLANLENRS